MVAQKFINPDNEKQTIEIPQCDLDKKIEDYESRNNRIPEIDEFYVDLGTVSYTHLTLPTIYSV